MPSVVTLGKAPTPSVDPVITLCLDWIDAHRETMARCMRQQDLEATLLKDFKSVGQGSTARIESSPLWRKRDNGYSKAKAAETAAAAKERRLLTRLAKTPATSVAGVIAKLTVVVRETEDNTDLSDFPLPQVKSALKDLQRLATQSSGEDAFNETGLAPIEPLHEQSPAAVAARCAFFAWSQGDERRYRTWTNVLKYVREAEK